MDGMIFAAGLGTRLRPLTDDRPKAMVELGGKPLLEHVILKMRRAGVGRIVVNVHHFAGQIRDFLRQCDFPDVVISDEQECLLDTGGGLLKARSLFTPGESVLIHNVDILSDVRLETLMELHQQRGHYATLMAGPAVPGRGLRFNEAGLLKGWENNITGERKMVDEEFLQSRNYSFCGIHIVSSGFLKNMIHQGIFSIIDEYLAQAKSNPVRMYFYGGFLLDLGTSEAIREAEKKIK